jgi:CheY-like chemotaxis protein
MHTSVEEEGRAKDGLTPQSVQLRVLLVEDSEDDAALLVRELRRGGYDPLFERVDTPEGMKRALSEAEGRGGAFEAVISGYRIPQFGAPEVLTLLRKLERDLPLIVVCDEGEEEAAVGMMRAGARDYVTRGRAARLGPAIERELRGPRCVKMDHRFDQKLSSPRKYPLDLSGSIDYVRRNGVGLIISGKTEACLRSRLARRLGFWAFSGVGSRRGVGSD